MEENEEKTENLSDKVKKFKKKVTLTAYDGVKKASSEAAKGSGKFLFKKVVGSNKVEILKNGSAFLRNYINENMAKDNPTGATAGAFVEYTFKHAIGGIKKGVGSVINFLERESNQYHRFDIIPEVEIIKHLVGGCIQDDFEQGKESRSQGGVDYTIQKSEKELAISLEHGLLEHTLRTVEVNYIFDKNTLSELSSDLDILADDLLKRVNRLSDPSINELDKTTQFQIPRGEKGEATYILNFKKDEKSCEVCYSPENKKEGIILKYKTQEAKENGKERRI
ncbi:MAG: hypothetical protein ISS23_01340 [Nanoarchaeota archaeon]|nr:hypothetical protein [Nanoarchaeota archaeon]